MIKNHSKNKAIVRKYRKVKSILGKTLGLMFKSKPESLIFVFSREKIVPLHTFFMKFPIDVLFLNEDWKVVELKEDFRPFQYYRPKKKAMFIIELPEGSILKSKTKVGDIISFK